MVIKLLYLAHDQEKGYKPTLPWRKGGNIIMGQGFTNYWLLNN
jgi:hypothetical protein